MQTNGPPVSFYSAAKYSMPLLTESGPAVVLTLTRNLTLTPQLKIRIMRLRVRMLKRLKNADIDTRGLFC
jgi:hypothetical protein